MATNGIMINTSGGLTSSSTLTNTGANGQLQITGLASGLNTNMLIQATLLQKEQPMQAINNELNGLQVENSSISAIQTSLQAVSLDAMMLGEPSLFFNVQSITSSDPTLVSAATTNGPGAVVGSSMIMVNQLASASQRTFSYTTPSAADTLTIDGQSLSLSSGETAASAASAINASNSLDVWATATTDSSGNQQLVLSSRSTGNLDSGAGTYINVQDNGVQVSGTGTYGQSGYVAGSAGSVLTEVGSLAQDGQDAAYSVNGGSTQYSHTDTVTSALAGVTLTLSGVTANPVTVTTNSPGPDTASIVKAVQQFVSDYNSAISGIQQQVNTMPASTTNPTSYNPNSGSLFGDVGLESLLGSMRETMYSPGTGLPAGMAALSDIGISTGTSNGTVSQSSLTGQLTVDTNKLTAELQSNPNGVKAVLAAWSSGFQQIVNNAAGPGGSLATRINGNNSLITNLQSQLSSMQQMFTEEEANMQAQWAQVEATLSKLKSQQSSVSGFSGISTSSGSSTGG